MPATSERSSAASAGCESLLVEMRCEEMPPVLISRAAYQLPVEIVCGLHRAGLLQREKGFDPVALRKRHPQDFDAIEMEKLNPDANPNEWGMEVGATSRRIAMVIEGVKAGTAASVTTKRGPACDQSEKALKGFLQANGAAKEDLIRITSEVNDKEYFALELKSPAVPLADLLGKIIERALKNLSLPRSMRWGENEYRFLRPIQGWCIIHGTKPIEAKIHEITAGSSTEGHRFLAAGEKIAIERADAMDYLRLMRAHKVLATRRSRLDQFIAVAERSGIHLAEYGDARESTQYVDACEWPIPHPIEIERRFTDESVSGLPPQFVSISLGKHLNTILPELGAGRKEYPPIIFVADNVFSDEASNENFRRGVRRVINARLEDLKYGYEEDLDLSVELMKKNLAGITHLEGWGSLLDRAERLEKIAGAIAKRIRKARDMENEDNFAEVAKVHEYLRGKFEIEDGLTADGGLTEEMQSTVRSAAKHCLLGLGTLVGDEYPESAREITAAYLGKLGKRGDPAEFGLATQRQLHDLERIVRLSSPENEDGGQDNIAAAALILADELERISVFTLEGKLPSGSSDPFALRRSAFRALRELLLISQPSLPTLLELVFERVCDSPGADFSAERIAEAQSNAAEFIYQRLAASLPKIIESKIEMAKSDEAAVKFLFRIPSAVASAKKSHIINSRGCIEADQKERTDLISDGHYVSAMIAEEEGDGLIISYSSSPLRESIYNCAALAEFFHREEDRDAILDLHKRLHNIHDNNSRKRAWLKDAIGEMKDTEMEEKDLSREILAWLESLNKISGGTENDPVVAKTGKALQLIRDDIAPRANKFIDEYRLNDDDPKVKARRQALAGAVLNAMDSIADMRMLYS